MQQASLIQFGESLVIMLPNTMAPHGKQLEMDFQMQDIIWPISIVFFME